MGQYEDSIIPSTVSLVESEKIFANDGHLDNYPQFVVRGGGHELQKSDNMGFVT